MGKLELVTPGDVVELVEGMQDLYIMGTVDGFQKVTKIDGLEEMSALTVSCVFIFFFVDYLWPPFPSLPVSLSPSLPSFSLCLLPQPASVAPLTLLPCLLSQGPIVLCLGCMCCRPLLVCWSSQTRLMHPICPSRAQEMTLQSCLIAKMEGLEGLTSLKRLTLYDNQILTLNVPPSLAGLTYLDMSYNLVKSTAPLAACPLLVEVRAEAGTRKELTPKACHICCDASTLPTEWTSKLI